MKLNTNTYATAIKKQGPVRGWFTRNAELHFFGCNSDNYAEAIAAAYLPQGATAFGTEHWALVDKGLAGMDYDDDQEIDDVGEATAANLAELFAMEGWTEHDGQQ